MSIADLFARFDAKNHPHARSMMKEADKIQKDFEQGVLRRSADGKHLNET